MDGYVIQHSAVTLFLTLATVAINHSFIHRSFAAAVSQAVGEDPAREQYQLPNNVMAMRAARMRMKGKNYPPPPRLAMISTHISPSGSVKP